jgi:hypothetical protein
MMTSIKLFKLTTKPPAHLDDHLLCDLGISRIDSEFAPHAPLAYERVENARTFLDKWVTRNVPETASLDKKSAMQLAVRCANDAGEEGISKTELEEAAGEELTNCMIDAQLAGAEAKLVDLFD